MLNCVHCTQKEVLNMNKYLYELYEYLRENDPSVSTQVLLDDWFKTLSDEQKKALKGNN